MLLSPVRTGLQAKMEKVVHIISQFNGAVVALSAGVDSSLVAALARRALGDRVVAVTALSESLAPGEMEIARKTATQIGIRHIIVRTDEMQNANYKANPSNRCYYCKDTLYRELRRQADMSNFEAGFVAPLLLETRGTRPAASSASQGPGTKPLPRQGPALNK